MTTTINDHVRAYYSKFIASQIKEMEAKLEEYIWANFKDEIRESKKMFFEFENSKDIGIYFDLYSHSPFIPKPIASTFVGIPKSDDNKAAKKAYNYLIALVKTANYKFSTYDFKYQISATRYRPYKHEDDDYYAAMFIVVVPREFKDPNKY